MKKLSELTNGIVSSSATLVAIFALGTSLYEARLNREQQRASVWPYVTQGNSGEGGFYNRIVTNEGMGPALVKSFEVWVSADTVHPDSLRVYHVVRSWREVFDSLHIPVARGARSYSSTVARGIVIRAGATVNVFTMPDTALTFTFFAASHGMDTRICYCSLYGDCWLQRSHAVEPTPVDACADDPSRQFGR